MKKLIYNLKALFKVLKWFIKKCKFHMHVIGLFHLNNRNISLVGLFKGILKTFHSLPDFWRRSESSRSFPVPIWRFLEAARYPSSSRNLKGIFWQFWEKKNQFVIRLRYGGTTYGCLIKNIFLSFPFLKARHKLRIKFLAHILNFNGKKSLLMEIPINSK